MFLTIWTTAISYFGIFDYIYDPIFKDGDRIKSSAEHYIVEVLMKTSFHSSDLQAW